MRLRCPPNTAFRALTRPFICPICLVQLRHQRTISTDDKRDPGRKEVAVLGGGITGLSGAFYLSKTLPDAHITLYEKSSRLGGWVDSERVDVGDGEIIFEHGPHTIRPGTASAIPALKLIKELDLEDQLIRISSNSAAARNRYVYYPDHLVRLPALLPGASPLMNFMRNAISLATEPLYGGLETLFKIMKEPFSGRRSLSVDDESVGSFLTRRFGSAVADNIASAGLHGIYAGDIYQLSARSLLPLPYALELKHSRVLAGMVALASNGRPMTVHDHELLVAVGKDEYLPLPNSKKGTLPNMEGISVYTFKKGLSQLVDALVQFLRNADNVTIETDTMIETTSYNADTEKWTAKFPSESRIKEQRHYQYVLSTLSPKDLVSSTTPKEIQHQNTLMNLHCHAPTVMVVNLWYPNPRLLPVQGFGYLIPRSIAYEQNPEHALGVIFASESSPGQDTIAGTKLTVMLGGHWWDGWNAFPTENEGVEMAKSLLERHMGIQESPARTSVRLQRNAIPQYEVGYRKQMQILEGYMKRFDGRVKLAGGWYGGVGLNDCVRSGMEAAWAISDVLRGSRGDAISMTGLEGILNDPKYILVRQDGVSLPIDELLQKS